MATAFYLHASRELLLSAFAGWFLAVATISLVTGILARSAASVAYSAVMLSVALLELYAVWHGAVGGRAGAAVLQALYLGSAMTFAFTLLRTPSYAPRLTIATVGLLLLVFTVDIVGQVWAEWASFYVADRLILGTLLVTLAVLGARSAFNALTPVPIIYITALLGPIVGILIWSGFSFDIGLLWESLFFAGAVALQNRSLERDRDRFAKLASADGLTGVANRRTFDDTLQRLWSIARRAEISIAVAMIDIDHFKRLNDARGHQYGDEVLRKVASICSQAMRRTDDCFARYGGEEFAAIIVNADADKALLFCDHIRRLVQRDAGVTISIGIAVRTPAHHHHAEDVVRAADRALYEAKASGRNCVRIHAPLVPQRA